jgi:hypothetical protein
MRTGAPALYALVIDIEIDGEEALLELIEARMRERGA